MKIALAVIIIMSGLLSSVAYAEQQTLQQLIEKNAIESIEGLQRAEFVDPPRLWLHIQREEQKPLAEQILQRLNGARLGGKSIKLEPMQKVGTGPKQNQLRFFREGDEHEAKEFFHLMSKLLAELMLVDLSKEYATISWIKPGHFELWLSPETSKLLPAKEVE